MEKEVVDKGVEIDSSYYLMQVYNFINEDKNSHVFVYEGVQFWREEFEFRMSYNDNLFNAGEVFDFEVFKNLLLKQKEG